MADDSPTLVGTVIAARYRIVGRIGVGGMGIVHRAVDELLRRPVAVKFLPAEFRRDADRLARFTNEARALSALSHPNIVTIYEIGESDAVPFIAMELVEGQTLRERLRSGPLPARDAIDVAMQIARALAAAHHKGIVHRDIKPENVMIRADGYVKVLDFGLAGLRAATEPGPTGVGSFDTVAAGVVGTVAYMSPEQIEGAPADPRCDIFSLGVVLCEALSGTNPFARPSVFETISAIGRTPAPAEAVATTRTSPIGAVVLKTLQRNPDARYQTSADLAADLRQVLAHADAPPPATARPLNRRYAIAGALALVVISTIAGLAYRGAARRQRVREQLIPEIVRLVADEKTAAAFAVVRTAERDLPDDPDLARVAATATRFVSVGSTPPGAFVEVEDYLAPTGNWIRLGQTPLEKIRIPAGYLRWRLSKPGLREYIAAPPAAESMQFDLKGAAVAPEGMVPVPGGMWSDSLSFFGWLGPYNLPSFFIDRYEVTNRQYQLFVDKGGYAARQFWTQPFVRGGHTLSWTEAVDLFRDATGRPGPSTWEGGHYPEGKADYPVTGISWFEAAAYAAFAGKSLPVIAQIATAAPWKVDRYAVRVSNMSASVAPAGQSSSLGAYGTYDLIGNAREWAWNANADEVRFIMGRNAASYGPEALSQFDRSPLNGFRCVLNSAPVPAEAAAPRSLLRRDFSTATPARDEVFRVYRNMYAYDRQPMHADVEPVADATADWTRQKITYDATYARERVSAFLFLPKHVRAPFQTVVFFPSARVNFLPSSANLGDLSFMDYVVKSGRAVMYPIYRGVYERQASAPVLPGPTLDREMAVDWSKDLGRAIDYLETRSDIDAAHIGYLGVSQGAAYGVILAALEERLKAVVLLDGGYFQQENPIAGLDQADFAPRLTRPVLMVNGRYDATFPFESAQLPLFRMLGTPAADKRHVVFETPHDVRLQRDDLVKEVLGWYDKYLGRVQ